MAGHPLLARMREAGMVGGSGTGPGTGRPAPTSPVDFHVPTVQLEPEDSVSQIMSRSPSERAASGRSPRKRAPSKGKTSQRLAGLAAPNSTVSATQRNVRRTTSADGEESVGKKGWGKLRKAVKQKQKKKKAPAVPVRDLTQTPHYRMGERDQVIAAQDTIWRLEAENSKLREDIKPLVREVESGEKWREQCDRAVEAGNVLQQQLIEQEEQHSHDRRLWDDDSGKLRSQVAQLEADRHTAEVSAQSVRATLETTQRDLSAAREEIKQLRAEMLEQREQAARHEAEMAQSEQERRVEAAREARRRDAALEERILKIAREASGERFETAGGQLRQKQKEDQDEGASNYSQPSSPQSSTANIAAAQGSEELHDRFKCPHCHARRSGSPQRDIRDDKHLPSPRQDWQGEAPHIAAVTAAQEEWDSHEQGRQQHHRQTSYGSHSPQQSDTAAAPVEGRGVLTGIPVEGKASSTTERQRRAEWVEHILQIGRVGNSSPGAGTPGVGIGYASSDPPTYYSETSPASSFEEHARVSMHDRARKREDDRAVREQARVEEFRSLQLRTQEREDAARRHRWAMRHNHRTADGAGGASSAGAYREGSREVSPLRHDIGNDASAEQSSPERGRGMGRAYDLEARAKELEAEGAALRLQAEEEVAAAWASVENSKQVASELVLRHGEAGGRRSPVSPVVWTNERFWPGSPPSPAIDRVREERLEERLRSMTQGHQTVRHPR